MHSLSRALLQTVNQSTQPIDINGIVPPGTVVRRFGCNCQFAGNGQQISGEGYYILDGALTVEATAIGNVTAALYENGVLIPGTQVSGYAAAADAPVTLPFVATLRKGCCDGASVITCGLVEGPGTMTNYAMRIQKV